MALITGLRRHISTSVKEQLVYMSRNMKPKEIAKCTGIGKTCIYRTLGLWKRTSHVSRKPVRIDCPRVLNGIDLAYLESVIERTPDASLPELKSLLHQARRVSVSEATISRVLRRRGFTRKRVTRIALERDDDERDLYMADIGLNCNGGGDKLVFVDESACDRRTSRRPLAWAPMGDHARRRDFFVRGTRYSILPALCLDGVLHLHVQPYAYDAASFNNFIAGLLENMNPFPGKNSVIVMDNHSIHKSDELREMVEAKGCRLVYLPCYSPDLNPIEEMFSYVKGWMRRNHEYVRGELSKEPSCNPYTMIWRAVFSVTPDMAKGWFTHSGYDVD